MLGEEFISEQPEPKLRNITVPEILYLQNSVLFELFSKFDNKLIEGVTENIRTLESEDSESIEESIKRLNFLLTYANSTSTTINPNTLRQIVLPLYSLGNLNLATVYKQKLNTLLSFCDAKLRLQVLFYRINCLNQANEVINLLNPGNKIDHLNNINEAIQNFLAIEGMSIELGDYVNNLVKLKAKLAVINYHAKALVARNPTEIEYQLDYGINHSGMNQFIMKYGLWPTILANAALFNLDLSSIDSRNYQLTAVENFASIFNSLISIDLSNFALTLENRENILESFQNILSSTGYDKTADIYSNESLAKIINELLDYKDSNLNLRNLIRINEVIIIKMIIDECTETVYEFELETPLDAISYFLKQIENPTSFFDTKEDEILNNVLFLSSTLNTIKNHLKILSEVPQDLTELINSKIAQVQLVSKVFEYGPEIANTINEINELLPNQNKVN